MLKAVPLCLLLSLVGCSSSSSSLLDATPDGAADGAADSAEADCRAKQETLEPSDGVGFDVTETMGPADMSGDLDFLGDQGGAGDLSDVSKPQDATPDAPADQLDSSDLDSDVFVADWECPSPLPLPDCDPNDGSLASVSGYAYVFGPPWGTISNAHVRILELPGVETWTDGGGYFRFDNLPPCIDTTFELEADGFTTTRTETFFLDGSEELAEVAFQVPTYDMRDLLAALLGVVISPDACQIATTVSLAEMSLTTYLVPHGVPGATVTICPPPGPAALPIYFEYISDEMIVPSYELKETSPDGGVLFVNVPPGDYLLRAYEPSSTFPEVRVKCEAGGFANASPPKGLHQYDTSE